MSFFTTQRRYLIDAFFYSSVPHFSGKILDLGGKKIYKRGKFLPPLNANINWFYLNNDPTTSPDYLCDAHKIPVKNEYFDCIIISELLEHVINPEEVILEAYRVLKKNGKCIITMPFLYRIHLDPVDYQRWTDLKIANICKKTGFNIISLNSMGGLFAVINDFWHYSVIRKKKRTLVSLINKLLFILLSPFLRFIDNKSGYLKDGITTGWSIVVQK
jgi:SAM-dependent methyltransferase